MKIQHNGKAGFWRGLQNCRLSWFGRNRLNENAVAQITEYALSYIQEMMERVEGDEAPDRLFVAKMTPSPNKLDMNTGACLRRWLIADSGIEEQSVKKAMPERSRHGKYGMFWNYGSGDFSIVEDKKILRIGWCVGPRYGRGYDVPYTIDDEGNVIFQSPVSTWVS